MNGKRKLSWIIICTMLIGLFFVTNQEVSAATGTKYLKVNNTTLEFNEIIYVDDSNGNDISGTGSKEAPFKTVVKGFDYLNNNCREGGRWCNCSERWDLRCA